MSLIQANRNEMRHVLKLTSLNLHYSGGENNNH